MPTRSAAAKGLTLAIVVLLVAGGVFWLVRAGRIEDQLDQARNQARALLHARSADERGRHAAECIRLAEPLVGRPHPVGSLASLLVRGAAPLAEFDAAHVQVPPAADVEDLRTDDLLLVADLLFHTRRFGPADQLLDVLLARQDGRREAILRLAVTVRFDLGRDADVLAHCDELILLAPDEPGPWRVKAMVHRNHGRWEHFIDDAREALQRTTPPDEFLRLEWIDACLVLGLTPDARKQFDVLRENAPELVDAAPNVHARLLLQEGQRDEAARILTAYLEEAPQDAAALVLQGTLLAGEERFAEAVPLLEQAAELAPADEQAVYQLAQCYARLNRPDDARAALQRHRSILDAKVRLHELETRAAREPLNVAVRRELAAGYAQLGMPDLADFWTRAAIAADQE